MKIHTQLINCFCSCISSLFLSVLLLYNSCYNFSVVHFITSRLIHYCPSTALVLCVFCEKECVFEDLEAKQTVFHEVENLVTESVILSSSTSCLMPSNVFSRVQNRTRCIISHPVSFDYNHIENESNITVKLYYEIVRNYYVRKIEIMKMIIKKNKQTQNIPASVWTPNISRSKQNTSRQKCICANHTNGYSINPPTDSIHFECFYNEKEHLKMKALEVLFTWTLFFLSALIDMFLFAVCGEKCSDVF